MFVLFANADSLFLFSYKKALNAGSKRVNPLKKVSGKNIFFP
jgi:hypothetical protein